MGNLCAGRVAIVTAAGCGLGREYALMLAEQGATPGPALNRSRIRMS